MKTPMSAPITLAFTTRLPLAVMIVLGIKKWENRAMMPTPVRGRCAMSVSKGSNEAEYANFLRWAVVAMPDEVCKYLPPWDAVCNWRGNIIATCAYEASCTPGHPAWDEGYNVWWKLDEVRMLEEPIPCRGNVGMWEVPSEVSARLP